MEEKKRKKRIYFFEKKNGKGGFPCRDTQCKEPLNNNKKLKY